MTLLVIKNYWIEKRNSSYRVSQLLLFLFWPWGTCAKIVKAVKT